MIIVIDDARTFPFGVHYRTSAEGAAAIYAADVVEELWLDHDLEDGDDPRQLALDLAEAAFNGQPLPIKRIYVHSMNPVGARWLLLTLAPYYPTERALPPSHV